MDEHEHAAAPAQVEADALPAGERPANQPPAIDIQALADRVYALMEADLRVARARTGLFQESGWDG